MTGSSAGPVVAAASLPQPPLLLPGMTGRPVREVEELRAACLAALARVAAVEPDRVLLIGGRPVGGPAGSRPADRAPWSVEVGRSLLAEAGISPAGGAGPAVDVVVVPGDQSAEDCVATGLDVAAAVRSAARPLVLVLADGSARRTLKAPGYLDERSAPFDAATTEALLTCDWPALVGLDTGLADELMVAGARPWQVFAAAMDAVTAARSIIDWVPVEHYAADPFGVWYPVVSYLPS